MTAESFTAWPVRFFVDRTGSGFGLSRETPLSPTRTRRCGWPGIRSVVSRAGIERGACTMRDYSSSSSSHSSSSTTGVIGV